MDHVRREGPRAVSPSGWPSNDDAVGRCRRGIDLEGTGAARCVPSHSMLAGYSPGTPSQNLQIGKGQRRIACARNVDRAAARVFSPLVGMGWHY